VDTVWQVRVYDQRQLVYTAECRGLVELGRQSEGEGPPYSVTAGADHQRIVLAAIDEGGVSRKHALLKPLPDGQVLLTNQSKTSLIRFPDGTQLGPGGSRTMALPLTLHIGSRVVSVEPEDPSPAGIHSLAVPTLRPGAAAADASLFLTVAGSVAPPDESLIPWFRGAMGVLQSAASSLDFFDRAAGALVDLVGLDVGRVLLREKGQWRVQAVKTALRGTPQDLPPSRQILGKVLEEKRTFWQVPPVPAGSLLGVNALVAAPILDRRGEVIGALYGDRVRSAATRPAAEPISRLQAVLVELLASGVAAGLARLEQEQAALEGRRKLLQMERELEIGREIQAGFLPDELPRVAGWEVGSHFRPAREVAGDFFDVFFGIGHDQLVLVIADVCDKGLGAALYMTLLRSLLRAFALQAIGSYSAGDDAGQSLPAGLTTLSAVGLTNNYVARTHAKACMFATVFFGILDLGTGELAYINAGHDTPVLVGPGGPKARLGVTGPVVGITPDTAYEIDRVTLEPGDTLFLYTDGVTEARNPAGEFFTEKRLLALLESRADSVARLLETVVADVQAHAAGADPSDDVTMLAVRRLG
jgi:sigma-B regulation protein RsbU (phosphoserine phosphatase)